MTSSEQTAANRRNAQASTGPKSARGKQSSRLNALKHGLRAVEVLIPDENWDEFETFRLDVIRSLEAVAILFLSQL